MDWTTSVTAINAVTTDVVPVMGALIAVSIVIYGFKRVRSLIR